MKSALSACISDVFGAQCDVQALPNINGALTHWVVQNRGEVVINLILHVYCHITSLQM